MNSSKLQRRRVRGFSLIELLVSMAIALVVTLAISTVLIQGESGKRSTTSVSDMNQTATYLTYVLDRQVRSAGSGFSQRWKEAFGCVLNVKVGAATLPRLVPIGAPLASAPGDGTQSFRLAPLMIVSDGANGGGEVRGDLITVMSGSSGYGEMPQLTKGVTSGSTSSTLVLANTLEYSPGDLVLLADPTVPGCITEQVSAVAPGTLTLSGTDYVQTASGVGVSNFGSTSYAIQLGNTASAPPSNPPVFTVFGVGANGVLSSYDLLTNNGSNTPDPIAEGVVEMRAVYGLDTDPPSHQVQTWVRPDSPGFTAAELNAADSATKLRLRRIVAVRLGLILRTSLYEKNQIRTGLFSGTATSDQTITLFSDLPIAAQRTRILSASNDDLHYRYRTVEVTIPLRNVLMAP